LWTANRFLINAASRFAALNPAELTANQQIFGRGEAAPFVGYFQDFCHGSAAVQYRFTRERSLAQFEPLTCEVSID
jgi:hypothetical protein